MITKMAIAIRHQLHNWLRGTAAVRWSASGLRDIVQQTFHFQNQPDLHIAFTRGIDYYE